MKQIVKLRVKKLASGQGSYYLDWFRNGQRFCEYLQLYVDLIHNDRDTRERNKETEAIAMNLRNKKENDLIYGKVSFRNPKELRKMTVIDYLQRKADSTKTCGVIAVIKKTLGENYLMVNLTEDDIEEFYSFLSENYEPNTVASYLSTLRNAIKFAIDDNILTEKILRNYPRTGTVVKPVTYLTLDEVKRLRDGEWHHDIGRRAFIFSCFTGLRLSDVRKLKWSEITTDNRIIFSQQKTQMDKHGNAYAYTTIPLNAQAKDMLGKRGAPDELVFGELPLKMTLARDMKRAAKIAGIEKNVHFHIARHTYAVALITHGVDIFTVSKLLGHRDVATTSRYYANLTDDLINAAVAKIPSLD